ncbi:uncharacterized protein KY384_006648 [Bacidia gigantensis]|uniref:uncharacterized protein n=1 Tax=Bacidia gigantensis TaxID=2732470 RepID=UPI001D0425EE|nr:uncharacterized protein KY384_006648 [Bacidia gigantensis]KAG8528959.1 hypothetical protein KY384_006648 [Bacidia gigantensis]
MEGSKGDQNDARGGKKSVYRSKHERKPRLLLMGLKRSGKSSISNVVFRKMTPSDTIFLDTTTTIQKEATHTFMDFQIWDLPGQIDYLDPSFDAESIFGGVGAMVWVLDALDNYMETVNRLTETVVHLQESYPSIKYAVFIHKIDSLTEDLREDTVRDITQRITDDLFDSGLENPPISYHSTSIFDSSIFEAFSKVMQGLVPQMPILESLLNTITAACRFEKVYIFDVISKIYIASDTSPVDLRSYELCSDYINIIVDLSEVYGWHQETEFHEGEQLAALQSHGAESYVSSVKGYTLYLREINRNLSFIGVSKDPNFDKEKPLIDYDVGTLRETLLEVLDYV